MTAWAMGLGCSDPSTGPRDAQTIVDQLHQSLTQAGVSGRLVLIGQSAGGLFVRVYATKYFSTIAGLVLVDATPPESFDRIPDNHETPGQRAARHREAWYSKIKDMVGVSRLTGRCQPPLPSALRSYERYALAEACRPEYETSWLGEMDSFEVSASEARNTSFGSLPLLVISQDPDRPKPGWPARDINANPIWAAMQEQLKTLSTRSRRVIARGSGQRIAADALNEAMERLEARDWKAWADNRACVFCQTVDRHSVCIRCIIDEDAHRGRVAARNAHRP